MKFGSSFERAQFFWGPALTTAVIAVVEIGRLFDVTIPNPQLFTAVAIAFAAYSGGYRGGLTSAAIGVAYAFYFFATSGAYFSYTDPNLKKVIVNIITLPSIAILVSELNKKYKDSINREVNAFFANANAPILALDKHGRVTAWNQYLENMTGYRREDVLGRPIHRHEVFGGKSGERHAFWSLEADRRHSEILEIPLLSKEGGPINLLASATTRRDRDGARDGVICIGQDITERKNAERQLRQIVDSLQDGFVLYDADDRLVLWNEKWFALHKVAADVIGIGTRYEDLIRTNVERGLYPEAAGREEEFIQGCIHRHRNPTEPVVRCFAGGRWIIIREVRTPDGGTCTINIDVTDIKNAEREAQEARQRAEAADVSKSEFLANMSHELRTPLNAIIGFASVMEAESFGPLGNEKYNKYTQYIGQSGRHLLALISDILDLSKVEAGAEELHEEDIDVRTVAESVLRLVSDRAGKERVRMSIEAPVALPALRADARKLNQILFNLLTNAIKFTREEGQVVLALRCGPDGGHVFEISDTGIGIAPENLPKVLSKFGQVDSSLTRRHEGTGLGLPLTKALVELHGGTLEIESEVDVGTTVTVRFPAERVVTRRGPPLRLPVV